MESKIDNFDKAILRILQNDCSQPVDSIAEKVNLSRNACWRRIKRLEEEGYLTKRVALVDASKLNLDLLAFVLIRAANHAPDWLSKFQNAVQALPEITSAHRMSGDLDYLLRVQLRDMADYDRFYKALTSRVNLQEISASFVMEKLKDTTALPID